MATKKNAEPKEELELEQDLKSPPTAADKDAEIARLKAELAAAQKQNEGYRSGRDADVVEQASKAALAEGKDPWTVNVSIRVPERRDTSEKSYWVCVNGRTAQIPANNQYQEMKLPFAEALVNSLAADRMAQQFADNQVQVYDPISNPHKEQ